MNIAAKITLGFAVAATILGVLVLVASAQTDQPMTVATATVSRRDDERFLDRKDGRSADDLVRIAFDRNAELAALRKDAEAAQGLVGQARLRPNPSVSVSGARQAGGMDNEIMVEGSVPLELYGRRNARLAVAERELELRKTAVAEKERLLASEIRERFGDALASALTLKFSADMIEIAEQNLVLVAAMVREGRRAPLDENLETVELNRLRAMFETSRGRTEVIFFELRTLIGLAPDEPLRIRDDAFDDLLGPLPSPEIAVANGLATRPDLVGARIAEALADARIRQARIDGRPDADVMAGFRRMNSGFPLRGIDDGGGLAPIEQTMNFFTFGIRFSLPSRNRNQGAIAAAVADREAAAKRREFGEIAIRNDVTSALSRFRAAARAFEIYRIGVRPQAADNLRVVRQTYEFGSRALTDYIAEQRRFIDTEIGFIDAMRETYIARVAVMRAANLPELTGK